MTKTVISSGVSLDGYTDGSRGDVSRLPTDLVFAKHSPDRVRSSGRPLLGVTTPLGMMRCRSGRVNDRKAIPEDRFTSSCYASDLTLTAVSDSLTAPIRTFP